MRKTILFFITIASSLYASGQQKTIGQIIRLDTALDALLDQNEKIEVLADSLAWAEGPVWIKDGNYLLFSDIPKNTIFKWKEGQGLSVFLQPSGYTGRLPYSREPGSNGLIINKNGELVACEHGDRRISAMPLAAGGKRTLADNYRGKRFNSPNDIVQRSNGDYYFTDPSYGLPADSANTPRIRGLYHLSATGIVTLLVADMTPNGLAFSPDEKVLYVGQSLPGKAIIMAFPVHQNGSLGRGTVFFDANAMSREGLKGLPDGMKVDRKGNLFATGPGGVMVISPQGKLLGRIETHQPTANCAWGDDGSTLYITANMLLCRVRTRTKGIGF